MPRDTARSKRPTTIQIVITGAFLLLAALFFLGPRLVEPPGRDQALFLAQADRLLAGDDLYVDVWEHKPPGILLVYAASLFSLGRGYLSAQLVSLLAALVTALLLVAIARRLGAKPAAGLAGACFYLAGQGGLAFGGYWATAQAEVFMDPMVAVALWWLLGLRSRNSVIVPALAGAALGVAVILKYSALPMVGAFIPIVIALPRAERPRAAAAGLAGLAAVGALLLGYMAVTGRAGDFWAATVTFNLAHGEIAARPLFEHFGAKLFYRPELLVAPYLFAALAIISLGRIGAERRAGGLIPATRLTAWGLLLWTLALIEIFLQRKFWIYHFHVLLFPLCLIAAGGVERLQGWISSRQWRLPAWPLVAAICGLALIPQVLQLNGYLGYHGHLARLVGALEEADFYDRFRWGGPDYNAGETRLVAKRVAAETQESDAIFVWGFEAGVYFWSQRRPAARFLYDYPLSLDLPGLHTPLTDTLLSDLERDPPAMILILTRDRNDLEPQDSIRQLGALPGLNGWVAADYEQRWRQGDFIAYGRRTTVGESP